MFETASSHPKELHHFWETRRESPHRGAVCSCWKNRAQNHPVVAIEFWNSYEVERSEGEERRKPTERFIYP
jgi:hypothetical protein